MTSIEVPDWVVERALHAIPFADEGDTAMVWQQLGYSNEHAEKIMRTALTAALGAWVVPTACTEPWRIEYLSTYPRKTVEVSSMDTLSAGDVTLYTLAQEKPE